LDKLFDFSGKVVLITGGSRGLGYQMAIAFAERGADVIIASRKLNACEDVAREIEAMGRRSLPIGCHVGKWRDIDQMLEVVYEKFGRIDVLINNAGLSPPAPSSHETSEELFDKILGVNFKGPFRLAARVAAQMQANGGGCIINVSSIGSLRPVPNVAPYCGAKAALNAMTESFAKEYGPQVRVNTLIPGLFLTDIAKAWEPELRERVDSALGRPGRPPEIVTAALFLASPMSSFTTGSQLRVDGGMP
jgi:NAD(P)-dependent dehydrogenase (short-subunit alcohol dehydrogenase family)